MFIEKIERKKNGVLLTIEGLEYLIEEDCAATYHVKKEMELDDATLAEMLEKSDLLACKRYLYDQIDKYSKTEKGYRDKLYQKGFRSRSIVAAIAKAKELGYIDDEKFAVKYYERNRDKKGVTRIRNELRLKGVPSSCLAFLNDESDDDETVYLLAEKFMRRREKTPEERNRLLRHLAGKGFGYDEIMRAVNRLFRSDD